MVPHLLVPPPSPTSACLTPQRVPAKPPFRILAFETRDEPCRNSACTPLSYLPGNPSIRPHLAIHFRHQLQRPLLLNAKLLCKILKQTHREMLTFIQPKNLRTNLEITITIRPNTTPRQHPLPLRHPNHIVRLQPFSEPFQHRRVHEICPRH